MIKNIILVLLICYPLVAKTNQRPDGHAPISIMADHNHHKNELMMSYRFMNMNMNSLFNGSSEISLETAEQSYMMNPTKMTMNMHMIGAMWGLTNKTSLMAMIGYSNNTMTMINKMTNVESEMDSSGFNDLKLGAIITIYESKNNQVLSNIGISLPMGSINEKNDSGVHYPYGMQLGSGTYDLILGSTGIIKQASTSIGAQVSGIIRFGRNKYDYRLGNQYKINIWGQKVWTKQLSTSLRSSINFKNDISGSDDTLTSMQVNMSPMYNTDQGKTIADIGIGVNYIPTKLNGMRLATELSIPYYRKSDSISILNDSTLIFGVQKQI